MNLNAIIVTVTVTATVIVIESATEKEVESAGHAIVKITTRTTVVGTIHATAIGT